MTNQTKMRKYFTLNKITPRMRNFTLTVCATMALFALSFIGNHANAQCGPGQTNVTITIANTAFANEIAFELWNVTTGTTVLSDCGTGNGVYNACLVDGEDYQFDAYDGFGDGWNGTGGNHLLIEVTEDDVSNGCLASSRVIDTLVFQPEIVSTAQDFGNGGCSSPAGNFGTGGFGTVTLEQSWHFGPTAALPVINNDMPAAPIAYGGDFACPFLIPGTITDTFACTNDVMVICEFYDIDTIGCGYGSETVDALANGAPGGGWTTTNTNAGTGWIVDNNGTGSAPTGPAGDNTVPQGTTPLGSGKYFVVESSGSANGGVAELISPAYDLSGCVFGTDNAEISYWYHGFGECIGILNAYAGPTAAGPWTLLNSFVGQQQAASTDAWVNATAALPAALYGGNVHVRFESIIGAPGCGFAFRSDAGIDDVEVGVPPVFITPDDVWVQNGGATTPFTTALNATSDSLCITIPMFPNAGTYSYLYGDTAGLSNNNSGALNTWNVIVSEAFAGVGDTQNICLVGGDTLPQTITMAASAASGSGSGPFVGRWEFINVPGASAVPTGAAPGVFMPDSSDPNATWIADSEGAFDLIWIVSDSTNVACDDTAFFQVNLEYLNLFAGDDGFICIDSASTATLVGIAPAGNGGGPTTLDSVSTAFAGGNGLGVNGGNTFNIINTSGAPQTLTSMTINTDPGGAGETMTIWLCPGGAAAGDWAANNCYTLFSTETYTGQATSGPVTINFATPIPLPVGATGMGFNLTTGINYTNGTGPTFDATNCWASNADLCITEGEGINAPPGSGSAFSPRNVNATFVYGSASGGSAFTWTVISQPAGANAGFATPTSTITDVIGLTLPGPYVFQLCTPSPLCGEACDVATIVVNEPYIVDAGEDSINCAAGALPINIPLNGNDVAVTVVNDSVGQLMVSTGETATLTLSGLPTSTTVPLVAQVCVEGDYDSGTTFAEQGEAFDEGGNSLGITAAGGVPCGTVTCFPVTIPVATANTYLADGMLTFSVANGTGVDPGGCGTPVTKYWALLDFTVPNPDGGGMWADLNATGNVTFDDDTLPNATATFADYGCYELTWTADDGRGCAGQDTVEICLFNITQPVFAGNDTVSCEEVPTYTFNATPDSATIAASGLDLGSSSTGGTTTLLSDGFETWNPGQAPGQVNLDGGALGAGWTTDIAAQPDWSIATGTNAFSGNMSSSTGTSPVNDNTTGTNAGFIVYLETSTGAGADNLYSPAISITSGVTAADFSFFYHMFGATMGTLNVDVSTSLAGPWTNVFTVSGQQQTADTDPWIQGTASLLPFAGQTIFLRFNGVRGGGFTSDMAIDDILVTETPTSTSSSGPCAWTVASSPMGSGPLFFDDMSSPTMTVVGMNLPGEYVYVWTCDLQECGVDVDTIVVTIAGPLDDPNAGSDITVCIDPTMSIVDTVQMAANELTIENPDSVPTYNVMTSGIQEVSDCKGLIFDDGGLTGNYSPNQLTQFTIRVPGATSITLTIDTVGVEAGFDSLRIVDGDNIFLSPLLFNSEPTGTTPAGGLTITSTDSVMSLFFFADPFVDEFGWSMSWVANGIAGCDSISLGYWTIAQAPCGSALDTSSFVAPPELSYISGSMNPLALVPFDAPGEWILVWNTDSIGCTYSDSLTINIGAPYGGVISNQFDTVCTPPNYQFNLNTVDYSADMVATGPQPDNCAHGNAHVITTGAPNYTIIDLQTFNVTGSYNMAGQPDGEYCAFTLSWLLSDSLTPMGWDAATILPTAYAPFIGGSASVLFDLINVDGWCADTSNQDCFVIASPDAGTIGMVDTICFDNTVDQFFSASYNNDGNIPPGFANTFLLIDPASSPANIVLDVDANGQLRNPSVANTCYDVWMIVYNTATLDPSTDITPGVSTLTDVILLDVQCLALTGPMQACTDSNYIVNAGDDDTVCVASTPASIMLNFQNGDAMNGSWSPLAGVSYDDDENYNTMATFAGPGTYCLVWNEVNTAEACPDASDTVCITIIETPMPDAGMDATICVTDQPYTLSATMTGTWIALDGGTLSSATNPNASVTDMFGGSSYRFVWTLMDMTCGMLSDTVTITVDPENMTDAGPDQQLCEGAPTTVMLAGTGTNGSWNTVAGITYSNQNSATSSITVASGGLYTLVWTEISTNACPDVSDSVMINVLGVGSVDAGLDATICDDQRYMANVMTTGAGSWSASPSAGVGFSSTTDPNATVGFPIGAGVYTLTWTLDDMSCGVISDMVVITVDAAPAAPTASANPLTGCITSLPSTTVTGDGNYVWYSDAGLTTLADYSDVSGVDDEMFSPTTVTGGQYDTVWVVSQSTNGCFGPATMIPFWVDSCMAMITDPCACLNNATTTTNGQFSELVEITGPTGQTWTVTAISGYFETTSAAPPAAPTPITVGTVLVETSPGVYQLPGRHVDAIGFSVSISNGFTTFTQAATCYYPEAMVDIAADVCISDPAFALMGSAVLGDGSGTPVTGTSTFTVNGAAATMFDPGALGVGTHTVTITFDADSVNPANTGCVQTMDPITVNVNANNTVNAGNDITVCVASLPANIPGLGMGGNGATGSWTGCGTFANVNSSTTFGSGITATGTGTCVLTWTETSTNACPDATDQVTVTVNLIPTVDAGADQTLCVGETATLAATSSTGCGTWTVPAGVTISSTTDPNATVTAGSGTYTLAWTSCDSTCGVIQDRVNLIFNEPLAGPVTSGGMDSLLICVGDGIADPITYTSATQGANVTYIITDPALNILASGITNPIDLEGAGAGTCLIWAVSSYGTINIPAVGGSAANITGDCWALSSNPLTVVRNQIPVLDAGMDQTLCVGETAQLAATGTGTWMVPAGVNISDVNDPNATATAGSGTYMLTYSVNDPACGLIQDMVTLTFNEPLAGPVTSGGEDTVTICVGDGIADPITYTSATQGANVTYIITDPAGNILASGITNPIDLEGAGSGTCLIWAVSSYGAINIPAVGGSAANITGDCWALSATPLTVVRNQIPVLDAGVDATICMNSTYMMAATGTGTWTQTSGPAGTLSSNTDPNATFTPIGGAGTYGYSWSVNSPTCGLVTDNMTITVDPMNTVDAGSNQAVCSTTFPAGVQLGVGGTGTTGTWTAAAGVSYTDATDFNTTALFNAPGIYTLTWTETSANACPDASDVVTITVAQQPDINAGMDTSLCITAGSYMLNGSGGGTWTILSGNGILSSTLDPNATLTPTSTGSIVIEYAVASILCGRISDTVTITFDDLNTVDAGLDITYCASGASTVALGTTGTGVTGMWAPVANVSFGNMNSFMTTATFAIPGTYTLTWTETSGNACPDASDDIVVTVNANPQLAITGNLVICTAGTGNPDSTVLTVTGANPGDLISWTNGSTANTAVITAGGMVSVTVTTPAGCSSTSSVMVVENNCNLNPQTGSSTIIGITWCESDSNGVYNATDTLIGGVKVVLVDCNTGVRVDSTVTFAGTGNYRFNNVMPGDYSLVFVEPTGKPTTLYTGGRTATSNDADSTGRTLLPCLTVTAADTTMPLLGGNGGFYVTPPVSVELVSYNGVSEACAVTLDWTTGTESDLALFIVERSTDGINYDQIGVVAATGNSTVNQEYQLIDNAPVNGINYYRLVQVAQDGTSEVIGLIDVAVNCSVIEITNLYPNPAINDVNIVITSGEEGPVTIEMIDMLGRTLYSNNEELTVGENVFSLDISNLAAAPYFIGIKNVQGETVTYIKFVKTTE